MSSLVSDCSAGSVFPPITLTRPSLQRVITEIDPRNLGYWRYLFSSTRSDHTIRPTIIYRRYIKKTLSVPNPLTTHRTLLYCIFLRYYCFDKSSGYIIFICKLYRRICRMTPFEWRSKKPFFVIYGELDLKKLLRWKYLTSKTRNLILFLY